jgi:hypothetical protein
MKSFNISTSAASIALMLEHWAKSGFTNTDLDDQIFMRGFQAIVVILLYVTKIFQPIQT